MSNAENETFTDSVPIMVTLTFERDSLLGQMALSMSDDDRSRWEKRAVLKALAPAIVMLNGDGTPSVAYGVE